MKNAKKPTVINEVAFYRGAIHAIEAISDYKHKGYLELGCGDGHIIEYLGKLGATVKGTTYLPESEDYIRRRKHPEWLKVDCGVDLNKRLSYRDGEFDAVIATEVIEHIEGHINLLSEAKRILKPGGYLVLTTPNLNRILSRCAFAICGAHMYKQMHPNASIGIDRIGERHHRCVDLSTLHWELWQLGFRIKGAYYTQVHMVSWMLLSTWPLIYLGSKWFARRGRDNTVEDMAMRENLNHWMTHPCTLCSEQLCLLVQKVQ